MPAGEKSERSEGRTGNGERIPWVQVRVAKCPGASIRAREVRCVIRHYVIFSFCAQHGACSQCRAHLPRQHCLFVLYPPKCSRNQETTKSTFSRKKNSKYIASKRPLTFVRLEVRWNKRNGSPEFDRPKYKPAVHT